MNRITKQEWRYYITALAVVIAAVALALVVSDVAQAKPRRTGDGCISWSEWQTLKRGPKREVEAAMGVVGAGTIVWTGGHGDNIIVRYRWCGHTLSEGYFQIRYDRNRYGTYMANYITWFNFT